MASEIRVNKIENRSGLGTVTFADTGVDLAGIVTATTFSGSGASLTGLPAAQLSGTLPALDGSALTGVASTENIRTNTNATFLQNVNVSGSTTTGTTIVGGGVTISESGIEASGIGITCANINGTQIGGRRNIIINGDMRIAQRGTSSTSDGYQTVDRFQVNSFGTDEAPTQERFVTSSSDTGPWQEGFRNALKITNGNQTGGAGTSDFIRILYYVEAQDLANSGWDYTNPNSYITLSYWVKSSVAQTYYTNFRTFDGTGKMYYFSYDLSAETWTKIIHSIPGHADLTFSNDTGQGMYIQWYMYRGTNNTGTVTANQWNNYASSTLTPDQTTTWYVTNDAAFRLTGVQLEVGSQATPFEHRSFGEELSLCQRYYYRINSTDNTIIMFNDYNNSTGNFWANVVFPVTMRSAPTATITSLEGSGVSLSSSTSSVHMLNLQSGDGAMYIGNSTIVEASAEL